MITQDILKMLFDEVGMSFSDWASSSGYSDSWSDEKIYNELPKEIQEEIGDIVMNASWYHHGM